VTDYILGSDAVFDPEDIWEYIAADSIDAADRWIATLFEAFETIAGMPGIGHSRKDLTAFQVLSWTGGAYLIVYRSERQLVEIVAVTQGSRDIPSFLRRRLR
jgi:antitoxin ParD1/3/4/toxin ParE1/3/4